MNHERVDRVAAMTEFLVRCGVSDHVGTGVTSELIADLTDMDRHTAQKQLRYATERGDLRDRPAVRIGESGTLKAYTPAE